jgi:small subunit ribosomal protein S16
MLKIRLTRVGKSNNPIYRLVVAEKSRAVKRENLEILGLYNPTNKDDKFQVKQDRIMYWISKGAQPSDTVRNLLCDFGVLPKDQKVKTVHGKSQKKKAAKAEPTAKASEAAVAEENVEEAAENSEPAEEIAENQPEEAAVVEETSVEEESEPENKEKNASEQSE